MVFHKFRQFHQQNTRFDGDCQIVRVQFEDVVHQGGIEHNAAADGHCRTNQSGARAAHHDRDCVLISVNHDGGDFLCGLHFDERFGHTGNAAHFITAIVGADFGAVKNALRRHYFLDFDDISICQFSIS